jgi:outer membrane lipoprotein SlyB
MNALKSSLSALALALITALVGCASSSPDVISREDAQRMSKVEDAVVLSVRAVTVQGNQSGVGAATGGVVGGLAGYGAGGNQREAQVAGILAAAAGAAVGNAIEKISTKDEAVELLVQLKGGERRAIVQANGAQNFEPGDAVIIVTTGNKVRVAKAPK